MFQVAIHGENLYRGRAFPTALHNHFFKVLRTATPHDSIVVVVTIGDRVVNLLYGHCAGGVDLLDTQLADLQSIADATSKAYVRLISASKRLRTDKEDS